MTWTPDKSSRSGCSCRVFSVVQGTDRPYQGAAPAGAGEAGTKCCPQERGYHGHGTSGELAPDTHGQTSYFFCTYRSL